MPELDYTHRDVVDKLGVRAGYTVAFDERGAELDGDLKSRLLQRCAGVACGQETVDLVLATVDAATDSRALLVHWKGHLKPTGGIWLLSPKRGCPGYIDQRRLIEAGAAAGLVDNKVCSMSPTVSALRFVIRRSDRGKSTTM